MRTRALRSALFAALVTIAMILGASTVLPTSSVWSDNVWVAAKITTKATTSTTYLGGLTPGPNTTFAAAPVITENGRYTACLRLKVTTNSTTPVNWSVQLDTTSQPWNSSSDFRAEPNQYDLTPNGRYLTITGKPGLNPSRDKVTKGTVHEFDVCANPGVPPIGESSWMKITVTGPVHQSSSEVCKTVTAKALGQTPFWFRWQATVPTADMFTALGVRGNYWWSFSNYDIVRDPNPSTDRLNPSTVVLTSATYETGTLLKDELQYQYSMCLHA